MRQKDLTQGVIWKSLMGLAVPLMCSSLLQFTYNLIDMLFVGHLGSDSVASVGSSTFFTGLGLALNALVVIGTGIKVSHELGQGNKEEAEQYIKSGLFINLILGVLYMLFLIFAGKVLIGFLDLNNSLVERDSYLYMAWSAPMLLFSFFNILFARILSSSGNTKMPFKINAIGIIINIVLDPIFIYIIKWGVVGAAIATLIANIVMFILYLKVGKSFFKFGKPQLDKVKQIIKLGLPNTFQRVIFTLVNIALAKIIAKFGTDAIAAQRLGLQIESVVYMVNGGLNGAMASFAGQNFGAGKLERIQGGYRVALGIGISYAVLCMLVFLSVPSYLASCFVSDSSTIEITSMYLKVIAYSQLFNVLEQVSNGLFMGIGLPKIPATVSIIFTVLRIPMAWVLATYLGLNGIWWAISISTILKGSVLYSLYKRRQAIGLEKKGI